MSQKVTKKSGGPKGTGKVIDLTQPKTSRKKVLKARNNIKVDPALGLSYKIPECAEHYLSALVNPYDTPAGVCIPSDLFPLPSSKVKAFCRGRMNLGTSGIGWVALRPSVVNDQATIIHTTSASVGTTSTDASAFSNLGTQNVAMLPYSEAPIIAGQVGARTVSYGLRLKYIGPLMSRNGVATSYEDPDHLNATRFSYDVLNGNPYSTIRRIGSEDWDSEVSYSGPTHPSDVEFQSDGCPLTPGTGAVSLAIIMVSGVAGDVYEYEYYTHIEYIGTLVVNKTRSHADGVAFGKALEAVKGQAAEGSVTRETGPSVWERFKKLIFNNIPQIVQIGAGIARIAARDVSGGGSMILSGVGGMIGNTGAPAPLQPRLTSTQHSIMA